MSTKTTFEAQVNAITGPVGIVYYIKKRSPKYKTLDECKDDTFNGLKVQNQYEPMFLHGQKTDEELWEFVAQKAEDEFYNDQNTQLELGRVAVERKSAKKIKATVEANDNFVSWDLSQLSFKE